MASKPLILNEWVIHDLKGDNGEKLQAQTFQFLSQVEAKCDHIILLRGSPWMTKAYQLMKESQPKLRLISKFLQTSFILNPSKHKTYNLIEVPSLPPELETIVSHEDAYLIRLAMKVRGSTIITTDEDLVQILSEFPDIKIILRSEFLDSYM